LGLVQVTDKKIREEKAPGTAASIRGEGYILRPLAAGLLIPWNLVSGSQPLRQLSLGYLYIVYRMDSKEYG
jgi:hypothetical protein